MQPWQTELIELLLHVGALRFGRFVTRSGRETPYFVQLGAIDTGGGMACLGAWYARAIEEAGLQFDLVLGPAYKGIPLAVATTAALAAAGRDVPFCYDRKEAKDHGEGGTFVGRAPRDGDRVLLVEDVTTAGTAVRDVVGKLRAAADVRLAGLVVAVDRRERGPGGRAALAELGEALQMPVVALVTIDQIVEHARPTLDEATLAAIASYRLRWGAP